MKQHHPKSALKRPSDILLLVGSILAFVCAGFFLVFAPIYLVLGFGALHNELAQAIADGSINATSNGRPMTVDEVELVFRIVGFVFLSIIPLLLAVAIVGLVAKRKQSRGLYIASMVLGALFTPPITFVGGLFGLIALPDASAEAE